MAAVCSQALSLAWSNGELLQQQIMLPEFTTPEGQRRHQQLSLRNDFGGSNKLDPILREQCDYTSCFCEENVYRLLTRAAKANANIEWFALFISNEDRAVAIHHQQRGIGSIQTAVWDYHVVAVAVSRTNSDLAPAMIYDLDTSLPFPCPMATYMEHALQDTCESTVVEPPLLKWIPATHYLTCFSSDRTHMLNQDGSWLASPPKYAPIVQGRQNTLPRFIDMDDCSDGSVATLEDVLASGW
eukprot:TRINITY_DN6024_c0_g1_i1.p1 TRINITY_DN6024_c0_g1~~TRINITY_DN6024_c0_g1_i1.p1  ORF type:complete len:242 (+),score=28.99 TRINITY_DN6024_c0_g1_i1:76-801(+)